MVYTEQGTVICVLHRSYNYVTGDVETDKQKESTNAGEDQEFHGSYRTRYCKLIISYTAAATKWRARSDRQAEGSY